MEKSARSLLCKIAGLTIAVGAVSVLTSLHDSIASDLVLRIPSQVATEPKYIEVRSPTGTSIAGECIDILRAIERVDSGIHFTNDQSWLPTPRIETAMLQNEADAACGLSHTPDRDRQFQFIDIPLFLVHYHLVVRADDQVSIRNWDDVRALGKDGSILIAHGFGPVRRLQALGGLTIDSGALDSQTNLRKLLLGRGRFYYHRIPGIAGEIKKAGMTGRLKILPTIMDSQWFYLVVSSRVAISEIERLHLALKKLEENGELQRIRNRWELQ